jgi:AraC family transcriptional activator of pobA
VRNRSSLISEMSSIPVRHINATQKEPDFAGGFSVRDIDELLAGNDMVQELHRHDFFYILALKNGTGNHEIDFNTYIINGHSVFFMRPGQVHRLLLKAGSTGYLMQFTSEFCLPNDRASNLLLHKAGNTNHYKLDTDRFQKLFAILTYIYEEHTGRLEKYEQVIKANIGILFIELVRQQDSNSPNHPGFYAQERLEEFSALLETNIFNCKHVAQYAAMMNLSVYQLNAITKATLGKSCSELINGQVILEAKRCLLATSYQVNQTAYRLGYEDVSYFIRFFKKHTGHSPEAFRHNYK